MSISCIDDEQAVALIEGRVDEAARQRIDAHLDGCDPCRELVSALAMTGAPEAAALDEPEIEAFDIDGAMSDDDSLTQLRGAAIAAALHRARAPKGKDPEQTAIFRADSLAVTTKQTAASAPLERGDMVSHFRVMRQLGRGAMGEVYLARDTMLGRKVALKVIAPDLLGSERAMSRFLFEARATAKFNHPNIVTIHGVGEHKGRPYVALEYVEGENLKDRTLRERPALRETLRIAHAIAAALGEAHDAGILHRDLKPANVVMGSDGRVRVVDFGLAKAVQATDEIEPGASGTSSSTWLVGTPRYMAPEQWQDSEVSGAADVWALGIIVYELVSGARPYEETAGTVELLKAVCSQTPVPRLTDAPPKLAQLVADCLEKNHEQRPAARDVAARLAELTATESKQPLNVDAPFRGLLPFDERHAPLYFGRDAEIAAFIERMRLQPLLPILGPSGAGKTSFIFAGVVPRLRDQAEWMVLSTRPGPRPFDTLAARLERGEVSSQGGVTDSGRVQSLPNISSHAARLVSSPRQLSLELRKIADTEEKRVLLVVDQLEELFTLVDNEQTRRMFLDAIFNAADDVDDPVRVVVSLRHDFVDRLASLHHFTVLKPPDAEALRQVLCEPVERAGYSFEDDALVEQMIAAVRGEPSALALLQFAAAQLWETRDLESKRLLRSAYNAMGGVGGALAGHADSLLNGLSPGDRELTRTLLLRLVTPERTRRMVPRKRALDGLGPAAEQVLEQLTEARLVSVTKLRRGDDPSLELTHDALIHTWQTLRSWVEHSSDELRVLADATAAAELWDKRGRRPEELWRGEALADAEQLLAHATTDVPRLVTEFVYNSREVANERSRKRRLARTAAIIGGALFAVGAVIAIALIFVEQRQTEEARAKAEQHQREASMQRAQALVEGARQALSDDHPLEAAARIRMALEIDDSPAARAAWQRLTERDLRARIETGITNYDLAVAPDGTLALASHERAVYLVDPATGHMRTLRGHEDGVSAIAFDADGTVLVSGDRSGVLQVWSPSDPSARPRELDAVEGAVWSLALSPDGTTLASGGAVLRLVDMKTGKVAANLEGHDGLITGAAFASEGKSLVSASLDGTVRIWDVATGLETASLSASEQVMSLAVSHDGKRAATSSRDGVIQQWDIASGKELLRLQDSAGGARGLAYDGRSRWLAAGGNDGRVSVWQLATKLLIRRHDAGGRIFAVAFDDERDRLISAGDREVRVWRGHSTSRPSSGHASVVHDARLSPDAALVASAGADGTVRLWRRETGKLEAVLSGHRDQVRRVSFHPAGELLASASFDGSIRIWDIAGRAERSVLRGHRGAVHALAFRPDGEQLASGGEDKTLRLWDLQSGASKVVSGHAGSVTHVAYSPDGTSILSTSADGSARIWSSLTGNEKRALKGHQQPVSFAAFGPDGRHVVSTGLDDRVRIWDATTGDGQLVGTHEGRVQMVPFHPAGNAIGVARSDGEAHIHHLADGVCYELSGHRGNVNAIDFDESGDFAVTAGDDGTVRVWDLQAGRPYWRGVALLSTPMLMHLSHLGWNMLDSKGRVPERAWVEVVSDKARYATQQAETAPICVVTHGDEVMLFDADRQLGSWKINGAEQLLGLPTGCAVRTATGVVLLSSGKRVDLALKTPPRAIGWGEQRLLVATGDQIATFSESGEPLETQRLVGQGVVAVAQIGSDLYIGHVEGNVSRVGGGSFARASASGPRSMLGGPAETLVVGYSDGTLALLNTKDGTLLAQRRLHGAVTHMLLDGRRLVAATDLGDHSVWDLANLSRPRCELLADVWKEVPVVWDRGKPKKAPIPADHPCVPSAGSR